MSHDGWAILSHGGWTEIRLAALIRPALRACTLLDCPRVVIAWNCSTFVDDRRLLVARAGVATLQKHRLERRFFDRRRRRQCH